MKSLCTIGCLLGFASLAVTAGASEQTDRINKLATETQSALKSGNYKRVLELTYPKVVENMGGVDQGAASMQKAFQKAKIVEAESDEPGEIVTSGDNQFSVVPTKMLIQVKGKSIRLKGFLLAVSEDGGKHWTFLDAEGLYQGGADPKEKAKTYGLELPDDLTLPEHEQPVVESE